MSDVNIELRNIIEAALLVAGRPLTVDRLAAIFPEDSRPARDEVRAALDAIAASCEGRGIELQQTGDGFRLQTRERYAEWIARLYDERPQRYSRALLETLAIIAYRQPVTRGEIEEIRGVAVSSEIIKTLLTREWVKQVGVRDVPGKPALYGTTRGFLEHFNLRALSEMPPLAELRDVEKIAAELNLKLPFDAQSTAPDAAAPDVGQEQESGGKESLSAEEPEPAVEEVES